MVERLMFPAPSSSYTVETFEGVFVPRTKNYNEIIPCYYSPFISYMGTRGSKNILLYFHGNAEDAGISAQYLESFRDWFCINVMAMEYPGYGLYSGPPNAARILEDAVIVYDWLLSNGVKEEQIIILGKSIGTGPATSLAAKRNPGALILISGFSGIKAVIGAFIPGINSLIDERFDNLKEIEKVKCKCLIIHGKKDDMIGVQESQKLYNACKKGNQCVEFISPKDMTHNSYNLINDLLTPVEEFLKKNKYEVESQNKIFVLPDNYEIVEKVKPINFKMNQRNFLGRVVDLFL